jgi:hypothetical protein
MFKDSDFNKKGFSAERECMICRHYGDNKDFCKGCGNCGASDCCRCVGSSDWEEMQREFPDVPYGAEMVPISEDEELYAVYDDAGHHHGFIEMDDDEEDDAIDIDITDEEMNEVAEVRLDSESFNADIGFKCKFCGSTADGLDSWDDDFCSRACEKGLTVCGISDGKGQNGKYGEFCAIQYAGKSDADDNKQIIHIDCPNCEFSEDGWGMSFNEEMKEGYRAESFNAEGRPQGMTSTQFRHKKTGEIATQIPLYDINDWEEMDAESFNAESEFKISEIKYDTYDEEAEEQQSQEDLGLPTEMSVSIDLDGDEEEWEIYDQLTDAIENQGHGWLVESFSHSAESFEAKGIDTLAKPFEEMGVPLPYARLGVMAAGLTALAFGVKQYMKK